MAWGGGGPMGGVPGAVATSRAAGLPFAGVPDELRERVDGLLAGEPEHPEPAVTFAHRTPDRRPFTLRRFVRPHVGALAVAVALVVLETVAGQAGPLLTQIGIDRGVRAGDKGVLLAVAAAYIGSVVVGAVASGARVAWTGRLGERLMYELRVRVFSHLQRLSVDFFTGERAGRLMTRMTSDIESLTALFQDGLVNLAVQGLTLVVVVAILFSLDPLLAAVTVLLVVPAMTVLTLWFRSASDRRFAAVRERIADVLADLSESLAGIRVIAAFNRRRQNVVHHTNVVGDYRDANVSAARVQSVYGPASEAVGVAGQAVLLLVGGRWVLDGRISIGELTAFLLYLTAFFAPIQQLVQLYSTYQQGRAAVGKLRELLATEPTVQEAPDAVDLPPITGRIVLDGVKFSYTPGRPVIEGVDLVVPAGETLALVGPTGAGKSTIARLIARFHDPDAGRVLVDGFDVRSVTLRSLRSQLGIVPQEPFLFSGTIRDNVAFARPEAPDAEVEDACRRVGLGDLLDRLPDGIDSPVHERGASLSSGERQLLALARAFLARPRVLILDEATSNLDPRSEAVVERALDAVLEGRTAVVVAHRLATAMRADRIAVVDAGGIAELGTHDDLVASGGRYASLFATWERRGGGRAGATVV
jgi:ATP-binding cassette, subfamily B, bacterial